MPAQIQCRRSNLPKTWHIVTLAPGFDASQLDFPIRVATDDNRDRIHISSQEELNTLLARHRDNEFQKSSTLASSPQRSDSVVGSLRLNPQLYRTDIDSISIIYSSNSSASSETSASEEYDTRLSEHFVNGEIVCTGGLTLEARDLTQIENEARDLVFSRGRSVSMAVRRRYRKKTTGVQKVKKFVSSFFKHLGSLRYNA
ncbi:hypothetical protein CC77DRAFT_1046495 [Alternaria alternata]|uniref:Uncharacterized protein n=1 Tax=Alternaria alternata TaxID=5599 RepID=A0A177E151_ALTAL|nr:hypothetical protein CC77DRAFT_1046495 [Alternaria alternata]OAG25160.1 hypothetical protein CC77DRAFT_1046495 [Alternaria alternata]